jgi:pyruvate carboxylase
LSTKVTPGNQKQIGAPMPGIVTSLNVDEGQVISEGDLLMTLEAMKMETSIHAEKDGLISKLCVATGSVVEAKDLLLELE